MTDRATLPRHGRWARRPAESEHPLARLVDQVPAVLFVCEDGVPVYLSPAAETLLGRRTSDLLGDAVAWERARSELHELSTTVREDGLRRTYGALVAADASLDPVTRLPSRALLREHLRLATARARRRDQRVLVLHAGLDGLDLVAAGLGRDAYESVLRDVAGRIRDALPETAIVASARDGELVVLLADVDGDPLATAEAAAGQLMVAAGQPLQVEGETFELSAHVGVSTLPGDATGEEALLRHAEAALGEARRTDGPRVLFYDGATSDALERLLMTARLRRAVEQDELLLHFQPIFRLPSGDVMGVEALLRWQDPGRGLVPPADFIPVAEYSGLIEPIGRWVVDAVCAQADAWRQEGLAVPIAFNVSPRQFRDPGFAEHLGARLAAYGLDPRLLIVEITETVAMRDPACVQPVLDRLRELGVQVAIDDFGAGHSSLARLRDLEVDLLKIDRTFLLHVADDERAGEIVRATLDLATALDTRAVAEGVETAAQRSFLEARGCTLAQGYHLARPAPPSELADLLRAGRDAGSLSSSP